MAGTKGKGSTSAMIESVLRHSGLSTGLFTSPHLIDVRERIKLNGELVTEAKFLEHFWPTWEDMERGQVDMDTVGFFRFLSVLGLRLFAAERVDVAVIEVGIGGRVDCTNVFDSPVVTAITLLDLDHVAMLGDTIEKIAHEKAGIIKPGRPVVTTPAQPPGGMAVIAARARELGAPLLVATALSSWPWPATGNLLTRANPLAATTASPAAATSLTPAASPAAALAGGTPVLSLDGAFQEDNAAVAVAAAEAFLQARGAPVSLEAFARGLRETSWPGRAQRWVSASRPGAAYLLDGAHTPKSMQACSDWFQLRRRPGATSCLVFHCTTERNPVELLSVLPPDIDHAVFVPPVLAESALETKEDWGAAGAARAWHLQMARAFCARTGRPFQPELVEPGAPAPAAFPAMPETVAPRVVVCRDVGVAIAYLRSITESQNEVDLLVTGSLQLVGAFLAAKQRGMID